MNIDELMKNFGANMAQIKTDVEHLQQFMTENNDVSNQVKESRNVFIDGKQFVVMNTAHGATVMKKNMVNEHWTIDDFRRVIVRLNGGKPEKIQRESIESEIEAIEKKLGYKIQVFKK